MWAAALRSLQNRPERRDEEGEKPNLCSHRTSARPSSLPFLLIA